MSFVWTEAAIAKLVELHPAQGAGAIAAVIGDGCTRVAVLKQISAMPAAVDPMPAAPKPAAKPMVVSEAIPVSSMSGSPWSDAKNVEMVKRLSDEGYSAAQIANELNIGVSRNSVIGIIHRLKLRGKDAPARRTYVQPSSRNEPRTRRVASTIRRSIVPVVRLPKPKPPRLVPLEDLVVPVSMQLSMEAISDQTCKWPAGDPQHADFSFCGHKVHKGAYCEYHFRVAYVPAGQRAKAISRLEALS